MNCACLSTSSVLLGPKAAGVLMTMKLLNTNGSGQRRASLYFDSNKICVVLCSDLLISSKFPPSRKCEKLPRYPDTPTGSSGGLTEINRSSTGLLIRQSLLISLAA